MSTANKLTYLNTTKGKIKDAINLTGANILSEDTFRSYAEKLKLGLVDIINNGTDDLYNSFPKTTQTGTEIALNDTYEAPMEIGLNGNTHQDSYTGKNLLNIPSTYTIERKNIDFSLQPGTYIVSCENPENYRRLLFFRYKSNTNNGVYVYFEANTTSTQFTIQEEISLLNFYSRDTANASTGNTTTYKNLMIRNASITDDTYEPYVGEIPSPNPDYPQPIRVVTGDNTINIHGENLFNKYGDFTYGNNRYNTTLNDLGQLVSTANYSIGRSAGLLIENLSQNANYTFSGILVSANGTGVSANAVIELMSTASSVIHRKYISPSVTKPYNFNFTFNTGDNTSLWVSLSGFNSSSEGTTKTIFDNLQLEEGSTPTDYETYQNKDYEISLGDIELCKIGNYQDYLYKDGGKWYIEKNTQTITLDGTETGWGSYTNGTTGLLTFRKQLNEIKSYTQSVNIICDHFVRSSSNATNGQFTNRYGNNQNLEFVYTSITSLDDFKNWLSTNNVKILFALTSPTITKITDDNLIEQLEALENAKSVDDKTFISQINEQVPFILDVSALSRN